MSPFKNPRIAHQSQVHGSFTPCHLIQDDEEIQSFKHWMKYRGFETFTELCSAFSYMLDNIHDHNEYIFDGLRFALKSGTMNKIRLFIKWMFMSMTENTFELYAQDP